MSRVLLRRATADDVPAVTALVAAAYERYVPVIGRLPNPMTADYGIRVRDHEVWVLDDGDLVGVLELVERSDHLWVENVAVHPSRQREGHGRGLLDFAETEAARRGYAEVRLETNERMTSNLALYAARGYGETGRVHDRGTDRVQLRKQLEAPAD